MKRAILIGNGFTSNLITDYRDKIMMERLKIKCSHLMDKATKVFDVFRVKDIDIDNIIKIDVLYPATIYTHRII